jgi:hypothetical protein
VRSVWRAFSLNALLVHAGRLSGGIAGRWRRWLGDELLAGISMAKKKRPRAKPSKAPAQSVAARRGAAHALRPQGPLRPAKMEPPGRRPVRRPHRAPPCHGGRARLARRGFPTLCIGGRCMACRAAPLGEIPKQAAHVLPA